MDDRSQRDPQQFEDGTAVRGRFDRLRSQWLVGLAAGRERDRRRLEADLEFLRSKARQG